MGLAVAGTAVSAYLMIAHFTSAKVLACGDHGLINCQRVTTSPQSELFGIPVAVLGLIWFVAMAVLTSPPAWRSRSRLLGLVRLASVIAGMVFVLYLVHAELFTIDAICLWCTVAHLLAFALFAIVILQPLPTRGGRMDRR